jgi:hypothetical protein
MAIDRNTLCSRIAKEIIFDHDLFYCRPRTYEDIDRWHVLPTIRRRVKSLKPTTLAIIIWQSRGLDLNSVHSCNWLDKYASGRELLRGIAETVIIAEMIYLERVAFDIPWREDEVLAA